MKKNRESVTLSDGTEVVVVVPSPSQNVEATKVYNRKWKEYVNSDIMTNRELSEVLTKRGLISTDRDQKLLALQKDILETARKLKSGKNGFKSLEEAKQAAWDSKGKRLDMLRLLSETNEYAQHTAEAMAENDRFNYLVSVCSLQDDKPYFDDLEDYLVRREDKDVFLIAGKFSALINSYEEDTSFQTEEDKFLFRYGSIDSKGRKINEQGKLIDSEGRLIDENDRYVNDVGDFVDMNGNPVDADGVYVVDFEDFTNESGEVITPLNLPA